MINDSVINKSLFEEIGECLSNYQESVKKLSKYFNNSNIVGSLAEHIVCKKLDLIPSKNSNKEVDATSKDGKNKYQIKSRWNKTFLNNNGQNEFGGIDRKDNYTYLVLVYFVDSLTKGEMFIIESSEINKLSKISPKFIFEKGNKLVFRFNNSLLEVSQNGKIKRIDFDLNSL